MNTVKKFQKKVEDFTCEACGTFVQGNGYTNHCPHCLASKHVDIFPGDRLEDCGGLMPVKEIIRKGDGFLLIHTCQKCDHSATDSFREGVDNQEKLISLSVTLSSQDK